MYNVGPTPEPGIINRFMCNDKEKKFLLLITWLRHFKKETIQLSTLVGKQVAYFK